MADFCGILIATLLFWMYLYSVAELIDTDINFIGDTEIYRYSTETKSGTLQHYTCVTGLYRNYSVNVNRYCKDFQ